MGIHRQHQQIEPPSLISLSRPGDKSVTAQISSKVTISFGYYNKDSVLSASALIIAPYGSTLADSLYRWHLLPWPSVKGLSADFHSIDLPHLYTATHRMPPNYNHQWRLSCNDLDCAIIVKVHRFPSGPTSPQDGRWLWERNKLTCNASSSPENDTLATLLYGTI